MTTEKDLIYDQAIAKIQAAIDSVEALPETQKRRTTLRYLETAKVNMQHLAGATIEKGPASHAD